MIQPFSHYRGSRAPQILGAKASGNRPDAEKVRRWLVVVALVFTGCDDNLPPDAGLPDAVPSPLPGVAPEACGQGFVADGKRGCEPILPAEACPFGQMAVPGETECHEVAPCGDGNWGEIPVETNTQFVDRAYPGIDSDGTQAKPWTTITQGVNAAASGAIVAVAAGLYAEDVLIQGKPVRLWGRCPAMVEVSGAGVEMATVHILTSDADASEVRDVAITGAVRGIRIQAAANVLIENAWVHDVGLRGLEIYGPKNDFPLVPTKVTLRNSLIEQNHLWGVYVINSADVAIERTVVRGTGDPLGCHGGIVVRYTGNAMGTVLTLRGSLVERNQNVGVAIIGAQATIESSVVRDNVPHVVAGIYGSGIVAEPDWKSASRADVTIRGCVVEQNHDAGVVVIGSDATLEATVIRDNLPRATGKFGQGIFIKDDLYQNLRANATLRGCLVEQNHDAGISIFNSDATIETSIIRDTARNEAKSFGDGISVRLGNAWIKDTEVSHNARAGVANFGSRVAITRGAFLCNAFNIEGEVVDATNYSFEGTHGWLCGRAKEECTIVDAQCAVMTEGIEPPGPLSLDPPMP